MLYRFARSESAAVTVDWVVLTACAVGLALATITVIGGGADTAACVINSGGQQMADYGGTRPAADC